MGPINLLIQQDNAIKTYRLSNAEYIGEAWLAEVNDNHIAKIIRRFKCEKFEYCFTELQQYLKGIGEVKEITGAEGNERDVNLLENMLIHRLQPGNDNTNIHHDHYWNWLRHDHYMIL